MFNTGSQAMTHNDIIVNQKWYMGKWKGVWKSDQTCLFYIIHICGATSQKALHTDAASRPYTDQSGILHENAMEKELSADLKKTKESAKNMWSIADCSLLADLFYR